MVPAIADLPPVAAADYIAAMAQHVSSVCVITTAGEGQRHGLTATAVVSVSASPARLLVCVNRSGASHDRIIAAGRFCVNVLTEDQQDIAMAFAGMGGPGADRFAGGTWGTLVTGAPVLAGAAAVFDCRLADSMAQASHSVFFGDVLAARHHTGRDTLLYGARRFRQLRKVFAAAGGGAEWL